MATLSRLLGVASSYISLLESGGRTNPSLDVIEKLCAFYGVNRDWLIEGSGPQFSVVKPEIAKVRLETLLQQLNPEGGEAELRESKALAEIRIRLSQLKYSSGENWAGERAQIMQLIDDYAGFCHEHYAELKMALLKVGRAHADAAPTKSRKKKA